MGEKGFVKDGVSLALDYCYLNRERDLRKRGEYHHFKFLAVPKALLGSGLSETAILLYSLMLERVQYSVDNGWADEEGRVFIIFTSKEIMETFHCQSQKCADLIKKLSAAGLIEVIRDQKGKANRYLVKRVNELSTKDAGESENQRQGTLKIKDGVLRKSKPNDTEPSNPVFELSRKQNNLQQVDTLSVDETEKEDDMEEARLVPSVMANGSLGFRVEYSDPPEENQPPSSVSKTEKDSNLALVEEVLSDFAQREGWFGKETLRVNQMELTREEISRRLCSLTPEMIAYAAECLKERGDDLINPKSYALTALYNAPDTYPLYQSMKIKHKTDGDWYKELRAKTRNISARKRELAGVGVVA